MMDHAMVESANIRSVEAIESFRAKLIVYLKRAENTVEEISEEVGRIRYWLQHDGLVHWKREAQRRKRKLEDAQQLLMAARLSPMRETTSSERLAVEKAKRIYDEASEKLQAFRYWNRHFDQHAAPLIKEIDKFSTTLTTEMPMATAYLKNIVRTLSEYAETTVGEADMDSSLAVPGETSPVGHEDNETGTPGA
jgi:hypothetical protein